jgi:WD40 repeat protein
MLRVVTGHGDIVDSVYFDSKDMLVSGSWDKTIKLWNKNTDVN